MKKVLGILMICSLYAGFSVSTVVAQSEPVINPAKQALPEGIEMLRQGVISDLANDLHHAVSESKRFEVGFPLPFDEWRVRVEEYEEPVYNLGATSSEGIVFLVTEFPRVGGKDVESIESLMDSFFSGQKTSGKRFFQYQGFPSAEVKVKSKEGREIYRYILSESYIYQLSIKYPKNKARIARKLTKNFFNSLTIVKPQ